MATGFLSRNTSFMENQQVSVLHSQRCTQEVKEALRKELRRLNSKSRSCTDGSEADTVLDEIYKQWKDLPDIRFRTYSSRRFTQLIKNHSLSTASLQQNRINSRIVKEANTYLAAAEHLMSKALGDSEKET